MVVAIEHQQPVGIYFEPQCNFLILQNNSDERSRELEIYLFCSHNTNTAYNTTQHNTTQYNTIQYNTIQYTLNTSHTTVLHHVSRMPNIFEGNVVATRTRSASSIIAAVTVLAFPKSLVPVERIVEVFVRGAKNLAAVGEEVIVKVVSHRVETDGALRRERAQLGGRRGRSFGTVAPKEPLLAKHNFLPPFHVVSCRPRRGDWLSSLRYRHAREWVVVVLGRNSVIGGQLVRFDAGEPLHVVGERNPHDVGVLRKSAKMDDVLGECEDPVFRVLSKSHATASVAEAFGVEALYGLVEPYFGRCWHQRNALERVILFVRPRVLVDLRHAKGARDRELDDRARRRRKRPKLEQPRTPSLSRGEPPIDSSRSTAGPALLECARVVLGIEWVWVALCGDEELQHVRTNSVVAAKPQMFCATQFAVFFVLVVDFDLI